jgi:HSP20 family molecular chaperone IbpA
MTEATLTRKPSQEQNNGGLAASAAVPVREVRPRIDVYENADELLMVADMPGANASSVSIRLDNALLTMSAERTSASGAKIRYHRAFQVPDTVDPEKISAALNNGVLQVHLGKSERAKPRTIQIKAS